MNDEETYYVGICPLCGMKKMRLVVERGRHRTYTNYVCTNCNCETHKQKVPLSSKFGTNNTVELSIRYLMHHWNSLEYYFLNRREYTNQKVLVHTKDAIEQVYLKVCPICRSHDIIHVKDFEQEAECLYCKQCNFHSGYRPFIESPEEHSKLYTNWNNT